MTTLTAAPASVTTKSRRRIAPVKETRVSPHPETPFAEGLMVEPATSPTVFGDCLAGAECNRLNKAQNDARFEFGMANLDATDSEIEAVAWAAREAEFKQIMAERAEAAKAEVAVEAVPVAEPVAAPVKPTGSRFNAAKLAPAPAKRPSVRPRMESRPIHTAEDELWYAEFLRTAANAPAPISGGSPEPECGTTGLWSMPGEDDPAFEAMTFGERLELLPDPEPELSDDHNGAFGTGGVE